MSTFLVVIYAIASICIALLCGLFLLVIMGNLSAMKLLAKNGLAIFSSNIKKDSKLLNYINKEGVAWISISEICYSPIMLNKNGKYKNHNFLSKDNLNGELYLSDSLKVDNLNKFALESNNAVPDLSIIKGSNTGRGSNLRQANFSQLRKIKEKLNQKGSVTICENGVSREFVPVAYIDMLLSENHILKYESRTEFIKSFLEVSKMSTNYNYTDNNVIFLECSSNIDLVMVMLIEIRS